MTTTLIARSPDDLLAAIPIVLGFHPERSIVMLTLGGAHRFHARLDLPEAPTEIAFAVEALLQPALRNGVERVAFVLYTRDTRIARLTADTLVAAFTESGIEVLDCLRAHRGRWYASARRREAGHAYDAEGHPFRAQAVYDGHVMYETRRELASQLTADPEAVDAVTELLGGAPQLDGPALWRLAGAHAEAGTSPTDAEVAALVVSVADPEARDHGWPELQRASAPGHVRLWSDVVRRAPDSHVADPAAVLALAAWLCGNGALAWCALDRLFAAEPRHRLGGLIAQALTQAIPPTVWDQ